MTQTEHETPVNPSAGGPESYRVAVALNQVAEEVRSALAKFGPFASPHEGYAVILEELDELWHEVKHGTRERAREEAVQVAAMAVRFLVDTTTEGAE